MPIDAENVNGSTPAGAGRGLDRRQFLIRAGMLGVSAAVLAVLLDACRRIGVEPTAIPSPSAAPEPTVTSTAAPTATAAPAATPTAAATATATATAAATAIPTATPRPSPTATAQPARTPNPTPPVGTPAPTPSTGGGAAAELARIRHLLRRAGFGASQAELDKYAAMGLDATISYLVDYEAVNDGAVEARLSTLGLDLELVNNLQRWWLVRMIYTARPLQEKMTLFWHGLLVSGANKVGNRTPYLLQQNQLFRDNAMGRYDVLLKAVSRDPAMLIYLDSRSNVKSAPNENFARELMELFSLGVGNYSETDVRESARAFTGWGLRQTGFVFFPGQHDPGTKTFLRRVGNFDGDNVVDIILQQPAAAEFISRKLFAFFAYDNPGPEVIARLARTFRESGYSIREVVRQVLQSAEFYAPRAYRAKVKSPTELVAGTMRALGVETDGNVLAGVTSGMGQTLFNPPDVAGWPGGADWINSTTVMARANFASAVAAARGQNPRFTPLSVATGRGLTSIDSAMDYFAGLLLDGNIPPEKRSAILSYIGGGRVTDENLRNLVYFLMASPEYQLA